MIRRLAPVLILACAVALPAPTASAALIVPVAGGDPVAGLASALQHARDENRSDAAANARAWIAIAIDADGISNAITALLPAMRANPHAATDLVALMLANQPTPGVLAVALAAAGDAAIASPELLAPLAATTADSVATAAPMAAPAWNTAVTACAAAGFNDRRAVVRSRTARTIAEMPADRVVPLLASWVSSPSHHVRENAIRVASRLPSRETAAQLCLALNDADVSTAHLAASSIVRFGKDGHDAVVARFGNAGPEGPLRDIFRNAVFGEVYRFLAGEIEVGGTTGGFYAGRFDGVFWFREFAYEALDALFSRADALELAVRAPEIMAFVKKYARDLGPYFEISAFMQLAIDAASELGDKRLVTPLRSYARTVGFVDPRLGRTGSGLAESAQFALHALGETGPLEERINSLIAQTEAAPAPPNPRMLTLNPWSQLGYIYVRIHETDKAIAAYLKAVADARYAPIAYYNIACSLSLDGRTQEAVEYLLLAVEAGYDDVEWMKRDGDLNNLHSEEIYAEIVDTLEADLRARQP
jgi:tetratricopeptide (TPR) repeat protein